MQIKRFVRIVVAFFHFFLSQKVNCNLTFDLLLKLKFIFVILGHMCTNRTPDFVYASVYDKYRKASRTNSQRFE